MTENELIAVIESQRNLMIAVATNGPRIQDVNAEYINRAALIKDELWSRSIEDPNPHVDLWVWYGRWSAGDMPHYRQRRAYLSEMYQPLIDQLRRRPSTETAKIFEEPTGWSRVDRGIYEIRYRLEKAKVEEHFQEIGLLCREVLISAAQEVYDPQRHPSADGAKLSESDAMGMLGSYFAAELDGEANGAVRRHAKAALVLANDLQHHRTANFRQAALCAEAATSVVNIVAIISGRRDRADE